MNLLSVSGSCEQLQLHYQVAEDSQWVAYSLQSHGTPPKTKHLLPLLPNGKVNVGI